MSCGVEYLLLLSVLRAHASAGQPTAFHILNDNNLFAEKRSSQYEAGGRPFTSSEKPVTDVHHLIEDIRARHQTGDTIATAILAEIGVEP